MMPNGSPMLAIKEHLLIMTPKPVVAPYVDLCFYLSFFLSCILWLYQTQALFIICAPETDVTENTYSKCSWTAGHTQPHTHTYTHK